MGKGLEGGSRQSQLEEEFPELLESEWHFLHWSHYRRDTVSVPRQVRADQSMGRVVAC